MTRRRRPLLCLTASIIATLAITACGSGPSIGDDDHAERTEALFDWTPYLPGEPFPAVYPGMKAETAEAALRTADYGPSDIDAFEALMVAMANPTEHISTPYYKDDNSLMVHMFFTPIGDTLVVDDVYFTRRPRDFESATQSSEIDVYTNDYLAALGPPERTYDAGDDIFYHDWYPDARQSPDSYNRSSVSVTQRAGQFRLGLTDGTITNAGQEARTFRSQLE